MSTKHTESTNVTQPVGGENQATRRNVNITDSTWTRVKVYAAAHNLKINEATEMLLIRGLSHEDASKPEVSARTVADKLKKRT